MLSDKGDIMKANIYKLTAVTNMHVGSGDSDLGVIDNKVQRDLITGWPTIYGSSVKGALREHEELKAQTDDEHRKIKQFFGGDGNDMATGSTKFLSASLLSIPGRSTEIAYYNVTTWRIIEELIQYIENLEVKELSKLKDLLKKILEEKSKLVDENIIIGAIEEEKLIRIEDATARVHDLGLNENEINSITELFGQNIAIFCEREFNNYMLDIPVIARNKLIAGVSKNLWYEEIIPRETKFYLPILNAASEAFDIKNGEIIQIGANASVGQGYTKFEKLVDGSEAQNE